MSTPKWEELSPEEQEAARKLDELLMNLSPSRRAALLRAMLRWYVHPKVEV